MDHQDNFEEYARSLLAAIDEAILYCHKRINYVEPGGLNFVLWMRGTRYGLHDIRLLVEVVLSQERGGDITLDPFSCLTHSIRTYVPENNSLISEEGTEQSYASLKRVCVLVQRCIMERTLPVIDDFIEQI